MAQYLTFQELTVVDDEVFYPGYQTEDFTIVGSGSTKTYTVIIDGISYTGITTDQAFVTDRLLSAETTAGIEGEGGYLDRHTLNPDDGDYYKAIKNVLGIDMKVNHAAQYSGRDPHENTDGGVNPGITKYADNNANPEE
jgi:hypothetical protein